MATSKISQNQSTFLELLRAGLWEMEAGSPILKNVDYAAVLQLAEEQSVVGIVTAGLEHVLDVKVPKEVVLQFIGCTMQIERRNKAMNEYLAKLIDILRKGDIHAILVKGQGIAQCYERPLWRASGDIDLFLDAVNYEKAVLFLPPLASSLEEERPLIKHFAMTISEWEVELHGTLHSQLGKRIDKVIDFIQKDIFSKGEVRIWHNGERDIMLPSANNDVVIVFVHILQHLFRGGIGLRQVCDWCRLLWTFRDSIDIELLRHRLYTMGLDSEWKTFASLAVQTLGMPMEAMPLYDPSIRWKRKASRVMCFINNTGNFGNNRDSSYLSGTPVLIRKVISWWRYTSDVVCLLSIFPLDSLRVWGLIMKERWMVAVKGVRGQVRDNCINYGSRIEGSGTSIH